MLSTTISESKTLLEWMKELMKFNPSFQLPTKERSEKFIQAFSKSNASP